MTKENVVGATYGKASAHDCNAVIIDNEVGLFDFLALDNVLTQISELEIKSSLSIADATKIAMGDGHDLTHDVLAKLDVIGNINGDVTRILHPIVPGTLVKLATPEQITKFLGFDHAENAVLVGNLLRRSDVPVMIDKKWFFKHISIMGMTGAGKSNLSKVILESLKDWYNETVIIIDPHGEYDGDKIIVDTMEPNIDKMSLNAVIERVMEGLTRPEQKDFRLLADAAKLSTTIKRKKLKGIHALIEVCSDYYVSGAGAYKPIVMEAIKVESVMGTIHSRITNHKGKRPLVINLKGVKPEDSQAIVGMIADLVLELGKTGRQIITFIDEVHNFCSQKKKSLSKDPIITLISEGRKFDCGVVIMSQRPAKVDKDIISQCSTKFCLQVTNDNDIRQVRSSTEYATRDMFKEVQKLQCGQALLSSPWLKRPVFVSVKEYLEGD